MLTQSLVISTIGIYKMPVQLKEPFITSLGREEFAENIIVRISTKNGHTGFGECNPFMPINGESADTCFIVGQYLAKVLVNKNAMDIEESIQAMDNVIYGNNSIKSAFDIALHDLTSQHHGIPLYQLIGGKTNRELTTDYTVSLDEVEKMTADAEKIKNAGYPAIKIKLGKDAAKDIARVKAIRKAVGRKIPLRLDANQGWTVKEAIEVLNALKKEGVQYCEEPIPRWNYMQLSKIRKQSPILIMADECCCDHHDTRRLLDLKACDMINIKAGKSGGLHNAQKMLRLAEKVKMDVQIGAFMESRLAMTAFAHLALSSKAVKYCDFDTPLMHAEDHVTGGITYHENGVIRVPEEPGLGAAFEEDYLKGLEKVII